MPVIQSASCSFLAATCVGCAFLVSHAEATPIDNFTAGPITLSAVDLTGVRETQTGLPPEWVLGGTRSLYVGAISVTTEDPPPAFGTIDTNDASFHFSAPDDRFGYFTIGWGSVDALELDATGDGSDRFALTVSNVDEGFWRGLYDLRIRTGDPEVDLTWHDASFAAQLFGISSGPGGFGGHHGALQRLRGRGPDARPRNSN